MITGFLHPLPQVIGWALLLSLPITTAIAAAVEAICGIRSSWTSRTKYWLASIAFVLAAGVPFVVAIGLSAVADSSNQPLTSEIPTDTIGTPRTALPQTAQTNVELPSLKPAHYRTPFLIDVPRVAAAVSGFVPLLFWLWFAVAALRVSMLFSAKHKFRQEIERCSWPLSAAAQDQVDGLARRLNIKRPVAARASELQPVPTVVGWRQPVILLCETARNLPPQQLLPIIIHELAHIARHDALAVTLQTVVKVSFGHDAAINWLSRRIDRLREECCDDIACRVWGSKKQYAEALLSFADSRNACSAALAFKSCTLQPRISRLLSPNQFHRKTLIKAIVGAVICAASVVLASFALTAIQASSGAIFATLERPIDGGSDRSGGVPIVDQTIVELSTIADKTRQPINVPIGNGGHVTFRHQLADEFEFLVRPDHPGPMAIQVRDLEHVIPFLRSEWPTSTGLHSDTDKDGGRGGASFQAIEFDEDEPNTWVRCLITDLRHVSGQILVTAWQPRTAADIDPDFVGPASSMIRLDDFHRGQVPSRHNERPPAIDYPGDIDTFQIWPQRGGVLTITVDGFRGGIKPYCYVYGSDGNLIDAGPKEDDGTLYRFSLNADSVGYYIAVANRDENSIGEYMLVAHFDPAKQ